MRALHDPEESQQKMLLSRFQALLPMLMFNLVSRIATFTTLPIPSRRLSKCSQRASSSLSTAYDQYTKIIFDLHLPEGQCVGLQLREQDEPLALHGWDDPSHWVHKCLHTDEVQYGEKLTLPLRKTFLLGRLAIRATTLRHMDQPCLKDEYGRPMLPSSHLGSISHKGNVGVALTAPSVPFTAIGVDIERFESKRRSIARKVLTPGEIQTLGRLQNISAEEEVLLRFSLKEAIYKASHPLTNRYVSFQEAEVTPFPDGTATCTWNLHDGADPRISSFTAHWRKLDDFFLSSARCTVSSPDDQAQ